MRDWPLDMQATAYRGMVFLQTFSNPIFVNAFLKELEENNIVYDLQDVNEVELPNIKLPWTK